jgi:50S ribosomal protein L16 3-hydroxylase
MTPARFLRDHWQKRPLLVRGAFPRFRDPISPEELAGLACEEGVESRIVREHGEERPWEVAFGPHDEGAFAELPDAGWTLLVQELNRHVPASALLLEPFAFVPNVRVDDVMVSYAAPGGSVGPHVDSYDVFLIQGRGKRRWMYGGGPVRDRRLVPDLELRILERFEPDHDEVLEPGDMLYLPPNVAHHGVALTPCQTYSVGFRSPSTGEMWKDLASHLAARPEASVLLADPALSPAREPGRIPPALLARVRDAVRAMPKDDDALDRWFASFATRLKPGHELEAPRRARKPEALLAKLRAGAVVMRSEEGRFAHLPRAGGGLFFYVGGSEIDVPRAAAPLAKLVAGKRRFEGEELLTAASTPNARALLVRLFAMGALRFAATRRV